MGLVKVIWVLSLLGFLALFLGLYTTLPPQIALAPGQVVSKSNFFYLALGVIVFFNGALLVLGGSLRYVPWSVMPVPRRLYWAQDRANRQRFHKRFSHWLKGIGVCLNGFLAVAVLEIFKANGQEVTFNLTFLYGVAAFFLIGWLAVFYPLFGVWVKPVK
ncbi:MAG: hypothetical protein MUC97_08665 [Bernardetiaceae bacterium]|nr:hypothetical protein [Bernardetiaceae bacterium]